MTNENDQYSIGRVERDTGIGRDTLRIWERRYGFPQPLRNAKGERIYTQQQVGRLQRIRRLLDQGMRPGKLLPLADQALESLEAKLLAETSDLANQGVRPLLEAIQQADTSRFARLLARQYDQQGMTGFILQTAVPLLNAVGEQWAGGQLQIFHEHFMSEQLMRFLNHEIAKMPIREQPAKVLLATLSGEQHALGLLMLNGLLAAQGIATVNLGANVPMDQIAQAVEQFGTSIVGLTFSGAYQYKKIRAHLLELRALLPPAITIWVGGEGVRRLRKLPPGISKFTSLDRLPETVTTIAKSG